MPVRWTAFAILSSVLACSADDVPSAEPPRTVSTSTGGGGGGASSTTGGGGIGGVGATGGNGGTGGSAGGLPLEGFGDLMGACDELEPGELLAMSPSQKLDNELTLPGAPPDGTLPPEAQKILDDGNLGGSSIWSEVFAFEVLRRCELATLLKTEGEIVYQDAGGKKTDLLVDIDGAVTGVSVTRAFHFPPEDPYTVPEALDLLQDKLGDIPLSTANVTGADAWGKQILHVLAYDPQYAEALTEAWGQLDAVTKGDTIVIVTVTSGDDAFVY